MIWAVPVLLLTLAMVLPTLWPRLFPSLYVSDLYRRYEHNPHIQATYLHNFRVNDSLIVDATLFQALDSLGWETLKTDFNVKPAPLPILEAIDRGEDIVSVGLSPQDHPEQPMDTTDILRNNVMAISWLHHAVSIFYTHTQQEIIAVFESKYQHE